MQKGVCKCVFLGRAMNFFGPSLGGDRTPPPPVDPTLVVMNVITEICWKKWTLASRLST